MNLADILNVTTKFIFSISSNNMFWSLICLQVKLFGPDNKPVANEQVVLFVGNLQNQVLMTDMKGEASFSLDTALWIDTVNLKVGLVFSKKNRIW